MTVASATLRKATPDDVDAIADLGASTFKKSFGHSCTPEQMQAYLDEAYSPEAVAKDLADPNKDTIVAVATTSVEGQPEQTREQVVGFVTMTRNSVEPCVENVPDKVELQRIYVHHTYHGKGLGKRLAHAIEDMAREQGFRHMWLGVWQENHAAQIVYGKLGYKVVGEHIFNVGGDLQTDDVMLKEL